MSTSGLDYKQLTEEILFQRYRGGDVVAFEEVLSRTKGLIYSLILRYVKSNAEADEIFQEVFFKVCRNKDQFRESVSFKSWLVTITRNTCIDYTRKLKRTVKTDSLDAGLDEEGKLSLADKIASTDEGPAEILMERIEDDQLNELLDELPKEQKETFYLKVVMELTFEEIGEAMKCSTNTAKSRYRYALSALRSVVKRKKMLEAV